MMGVTMAKINNSIKPNKNDNKLMKTMTYSISRLKKYIQCPYSWYMTYIKGRFSESPPLIFGKTMHYIAETVGEQCYNQTWVNKYIAWQKKVTGKYSEEDVIAHAAEAEGVLKMLKENKYHKTYSQVTHDIESSVTEEDYSKVEMVTYNELINIKNDAIVKYHVSDEDTLYDIDLFTRIFFFTQRFYYDHGESTRFEMKFGLDEDWEICNFNSKDAYLRGIIDRISFKDGVVRIVDYKTNRVMYTDNQFRSDMQFKVYALFASILFGKENIERIDIEINYLRHSESAFYEIDKKEIPSLTVEVQSWVDSTVQDIERNIIDGEFYAVRNKYCDHCDIKRDGLCPIFSKEEAEKGFIELESEIESTEQCAKAWKRAEVLDEEKKALVSSVKSYIKNDDSIIRLDDGGIVDYYRVPQKKIDTEQAVKWILNNGYASLQTILSYMTISESAIKKIIIDELDIENPNDKAKAKARKAELKQILNSLQYDNYTNKFQALTEDEILELKSIKNNIEE